MTTAEVATLKRTELQAAACRVFGKSASTWTGRATNDQLREALISGEVPPQFANPATSDLADVIAKAIEGRINVPPSLDEDRVIALIRDELARITPPAQTFEVKHANGNVVDLGRCHRQTRELMAWIDAGCYPFLIGPAGSFKTAAAAKVAKGLERPFYMESMSEGKTPFDLMGFNDATGKVVRTPLREAWEQGGVFLCDEIDAGNANVVATLNALLSQDLASFPDGMIPKHEHFVFIAAGNTNGNGADMKFCGRNQLDGASLDRFVYIFWEYDEDFEVNVAGEDQRDWTHFVQRCRHAAARCGILETTVFATPRASINGAKALRAGVLSRDEIEQALLWRKLSAADAAKVRQNLN